MQQSGEVRKHGEYSRSVLRSYAERLLEERITKSSVHPQIFHSWCWINKRMILAVELRRVNERC